jgi:putative transposase
MNIPTNTIIAWPDTDPPRVDRVVATLPDGRLLLIPLNGKEGLHEAAKIDIAAALEAGEARILTEDPEGGKNIPEEEIPESHKARRDAAWELIRPLIEDKSFTLIRANRWKKISQRARETGKPNKVIYDALRKFWCGGQVKNALLPDYSKKRKLGVVRPGRKSSGLQLSPEVEKKFSLGIKSFFEKQDKPTLRDAYKKTIAKYFNTGYAVRSGVLVPIIPPEDQLPTERQFRYWYHNNRDPERALRAREGRRFNLKHRPILGESTQMGFGPGSLYQIDSTIGDIELVSSLDHSTNVGRPTLYIMTDVFSRCITGFNLSLDDSSYQQAALALENACEDKVSFCAAYGLEIQPEEWPCHGLPECILADRGELKGPIAENIVSGLGIRLDNTPPYRADLKGIVEATFRLGNQRLFHFLPGGVRKALERGDRNPRLEARLDILQLRKLVVLWILEHNRRQLRDYPSSQFQIADGVELTPNTLWAWGIENRTGILKVMSPETIRTQLLPSGEAGITPRGIHFRRAFYTCPRAIEEQWFTRAREGKAQKVKVIYDPRDVSVLYLRTASGIERCNLKESNQKLEAKTWAEVEAYFYEQRKKTTAKATDTLQREAEFQAQIEKVVVEAKGAFSPSMESKAKRAKGLRANKKAEASRTKRLEPISKTKPSEQEPAYIGPASHLSILKKKK